MIDRRTLLAAAVSAGLIPSAGPAQWGDPPTPAVGDPDAPAWPSQEAYKLWPKSPPGSPRVLPRPDPTMNGPKGSRELWLRGIASPEIHVFRPARPDGSALLALPGGGYGFLSVQNEGMDAAQRFNASRITVFVLAYRLPGEGWADRHLAPLQDAQRAMRLIRSRARFFNIDPQRLGLLGFSAGGHLAADLATAHDERTYSPIDEADRESARPAFAGLIYPVTSLSPRISHGGSRTNLLGAEPSPASIDARSPLLRVSGRIPPSFLVHAFDDGTVPIENSIEWIAAARAAKAPVEGHLFATGGHGFGFRLSKDLPGSAWPDLFELWMRKNGG